MKKLVLYNVLSQRDLHTDSEIIRLDKKTFYDESRDAEIIYKKELSQQPRGSMIFVTDERHEKFFKIIY